MPDDWVEEASRISQAAVDACKCADGRLLLSCPEEVESRVAAALRSAFDRGAREERDRCARIAVDMWLEGRSLDPDAEQVQIYSGNVATRLLDPTTDEIHAAIRALPEANP